MKALPIKKKFMRLRTANDLFNDTIEYQNKWQRWVCRYHLYVVKDDYSTRDKLSHPGNREEYIKFIEHLYKEMQQVFYDGFFDNRTHYDMCRLYLKQLLIFTRQYPLLWFWHFRLHF